MKTSPAPGAPKVPVSFETSPDRYRHWKLELDGPVPGTARLSMVVREDEPLVPGYPLKLNSYDLGVDIELCDAVQRLRFSHPSVRTVIVTSGRDRVFCSGANIYMLASSTHAFKVNFCKYTNETRLSIEDACRNSQQRYLAAVNGSCAGGGYELAMACDEIVLIDDGSSTVALPEVPLLGVLPGTGGLTRLVDKRKVRRDRADVFSTLAEGLRGKRAVEWRLVDKVAPRSKFSDAVNERARALTQAATAAWQSEPGPTAGIALEPLQPTVLAGDGPDGDGDGLQYRFVTLRFDRARRLCHLTVTGPGAGDVPQGAEDLHAKASRGELWALRAFRELDDALLRLRFHEPLIGLVLVHTRGDLQTVRRHDEALHGLRGYWLGREVLLHMARVLRRVDQTARSFFALGEPESCFGGCLLELLLAADRSYFLDSPEQPVRVQTSPLNAGVLPIFDGRSRLALRSYGAPEQADAILSRGDTGPIDATEADELGLVTVLADDIDFEDTLRLSIEERISLSPDALTGMEQNLRFPGAESSSDKIFGRLSAWQNWIFIRDNATGDKGGLTSYGKPERPSFDWHRT
ncbi:MAG: enoyl-CoA hydratase-related protein [Polyangia bacterium]